MVSPIADASKRAKILRAFSAFRNILLLVITGLHPVLIYVALSALFTVVSGFTGSTLEIILKTFISA